LIRNVIETDEMTTIKEFVEIFNPVIGIRAIRKRIEKGKIPSIKIKGQWCIVLDKNNPDYNNSKVLGKLKRSREMKKERIEWLKSNPSKKEKILETTVTKRLNFPVFWPSLETKFNEHIESLIKYNPNDIGTLIKKRKVTIKKNVYNILGKIAKNLDIRKKELIILLLINGHFIAEREAANNKANFNPEKD
jgi:hypothetical protein